MEQNNNFSPISLQKDGQIVTVESLKAQYESLLQSDNEGDISVRELMERSLLLAAQKRDIVQVRNAGNSTQSFEDSLRRILSSDEYVQAYMTGYNSASMLEKTRGVPIHNSLQAIVKNSVGLTLVHPFFSERLQYVGNMNNKQKNMSWRSFYNDMEEAKLSEQGKSIGILLKLAGQAHNAVRQRISPLHNDENTYQVVDVNAFWSSRLITGTLQNPSLGFTLGYAHRLIHEAYLQIEKYAPDGEAKTHMNMWCILSYIRNTEWLRGKYSSPRTFRPEVFKLMMSGETEDAYDLLTDVVLECSDAFSNKQLKTVGLSREQANFEKLRRETKNFGADIQRNTAKRIERSNRQVKEAKQKREEQCAQTFVDQAALCIGKYYWCEQNIESDSETIPVRYIFRVDGIREKNFHENHYDEEGNCTKKIGTYPIVTCTRYYVFEPDKNGEFLKTSSFWLPQKFVNIVSGVNEDNIVKELAITDIHQFTLDK